jgi:phospholipase C
MPAGIDQLEHIVVLMLENRSFDHMLGYLMAQDPNIDGVNGTQTNPDTTGALIPVQPLAQYQSQLDPDPGHHWPDVDLQIHGDIAGGPPMQGFIKSYYQQQQNVNHSHEIMYCFPPAKVPVITTLARQYAVFNRWFSSLPGPTIPNRAFAHFGTSFGHTDMSLFYLNEKYSTIYQRMVDHGRTAKIYYYDPASATLGMAFILKEQPQLFATFDQFLADCASGNLPDYSFIEPNYVDHAVGNGTVPAADQHPDHNVLAGEEFIAQVYSTIFVNSDKLWKNTALLIVYDEHGGIYDHVDPPACTPDEFTDPQTGFKFDRLGVRVPAVLVSQWVPQGTVVNRVFDHASIPATVTKQFIGDFAQRSPRELAADTFLDLLSLDQPREDIVQFGAGDTPVPPEAANPARPLSSLLREHVMAMREADQQFPPEQRTPVDASHLASEHGASQYIQAVMAKLHPKPAAAAR